jgi:uncharacterized protein (TIGR02466 family)
MKSIYGSHAPHAEISLQRVDFAPNSVWTFKLPNHQELNQDLLLRIKRERQLCPQSRECEGREMWQSQRPFTTEKSVKKLLKSVFGMARVIASFLKWDIGDNKPVCKVCWANIHPPGSYHTRHLHPSSAQLSGVYYIRAPENGGNIIFHDLPRFLGLWDSVPEILEPTYHNISQFEVTPEEGLCILFPAYMMHEVETNRSSEDRVGLAFNINFE